MAPRYYRARQPKRLSDVLSYEQDANFSRDNVVFAAAAAGETYQVEPGTVLGRVALGALTSAKTGTGNGARTDMTLGPRARAGVYRAEYVDATAGRWNIYSPSGELIGHAVNGTPFQSQHIRFQIAQGATAWVEGDSIAFTVAKGTAQVAPIDFDATDGRQNFYGFAGAYAVVDDQGEVGSFAIARDAVAIRENLVWPEGATDAQIADALEQGETRGLLVRV